MTYQKIIDAVQQLIDVPLCPDVAMLLKGDAISALSEGKSHKADAVVAKGKVVGVRFESKLGLVTLQTDDKRGIITRLTIYVSKHNLKLGRSGASSMTAREDIKKVRINKPLPAGAFKFKTKGLTRAKSIKQMVRNNMHK